MCASLRPSYPLSTLLSSSKKWVTTQSSMKFCLCVLFNVATGNHRQSDANCAHQWHPLLQNCHRRLLEHNHASRVGSDVTFTCQVENISNYKVTRICRRLSYFHGHCVNGHSKVLISTTQVAWLHSEKGIIAVFPDMVAHNDRISSTYDNRWS